MTRLDRLDNNTLIVWQHRKVLVHRVQVTDPLRCKLQIFPQNDVGHIDKRLAFWTRPISRSLAVKVLPRD